MNYPLEEKIGNPDLLVGREAEFQRFHEWIGRMPQKLSKSWAILGRRKSGKTAFVQRLFNELWSANGRVIPFYFSVPDSPVWYPELAISYYTTFASHYSEGLQAVYKYAAFYNVPITNETAVQVNQLCKADPFFISCVMQSSYPGRNLTTAEGVIEVVNYEVADRESEMSGTWREYIDKTVDRINDQYGKRLLLHLSKYNDRYWTPRQLKEVLQLPEDEKTIQRKLLSMYKGDLIEWGSSDIDFRGLRDGTLNLILRHRFEREIAEYQTPPDLRIGFREEIATLRREKQALQGKLNHVVGQMAEYQLAIALRSRKRFPLSAFFTGATDETELNITQVQTRVSLQREDGKGMELDVVAASSDERVLLVEVRKRQIKSTLVDLQDFQEKVVVYQAHHPEQRLLAAFLSLGGFTEDALHFCQTQGIVWATELLYF